MENIWGLLLGPSCPRVSTGISTGLVTDLKPLAHTLSGIHFLFDELQVPLELVVFFEDLGDLAVGVHCRGVVSSAKLGADGRVGDVHFLAQQVHDDLAREGEALFAAFAQDVLDRDVEVFRNGRDDVLW